MSSTTDRYNIMAQLEHLQSKYVGTGHANSIILRYQNEASLSIQDQAEKFKSLSDFQIEPKNMIQNDEDLWTDYDVEQEANALESECKSLRRFSKNDISNQVKWWLYNDIDYKKNLRAIMSYFCEKEIDGKFVCGDYWIKSCKIIKEYLEKYTNLEVDSMKIMFESFDEWMNANQNDVLSMSASEIGLKFFSFPLDGLLNRINSQNINGETFIQYHKNQSLWMNKATGWGEADIYQINAHLFKHHAFNANNIKSVFDKSINFENMSMKKFNDLIRENIKKTNKNVMKTYDELSKCFVPNAIESEKEWKKQSNIHMTTTQKMSLTLPFDANWKCAYCQCSNRVNYTKQKVKIDTSICTLCGIRRKDSVILRMRGYDCYFLQSKIKMDENEDEIIKNVQKSTLYSARGLDISCPNLLDEHKPCEHILDVAKYLLQCKLSIDFIHGKNENMKPFVLKNVTNEQFKKVFFQSVNSEQCMKIMQKRQVSDTQKQQILGLINSKLNIAKFLAFETKIDFNKSFKAALNNFKYSYQIGNILYKLINEYLQNEARRNEKDCFEILLSQSIEIENDIKHIFDVHIKNGNKITKGHALRFLKNLIHYEVDYYDECEPYLGQIRQKIPFLKRSNDECFNDDDDDEKEEIVMDKLTDRRRRSRKKNRFVTDSKFIKYGFGVHHKHPSLAPIYDSFMDEMYKNKIFPISATTFEKMLAKAMMKRKGANDLICKYFDAKFNILRNEIIYICHILAITFYTDLTDLCTAFRETYRRIKNERDDNEVMKRHSEFYYFGRSLFEAIEFFGEEMTAKTKVYHGLNKAMQFEQFVAYFNQPISTTKDFETAKRFATDRGITLKFGCGILDASDVSHIPKYLSVKRFSAFPEEDELLFYGENIRFEIYDIYYKRVRQREKITAAIILQKIIKNEMVNFDEKSIKNSLNLLLSLIKKQKQINMKWIQTEEKESNTYDDEKKEENSNSDVSAEEYGRALFGYFCNHDKAYSVEITQFEKLPKEVQNELFYGDANGNKLKKLSFVPIFILFASLKAITFTDSCIDQIDCSEKYIEAAFECILTMKTLGRSLREIKFQSTLQTVPKDNVDLSRFERKFNQKFKDNKLQWSIKYEFQGEKHNVILRTNHEAYVQELRIQHAKEMQSLKESYETKMLLLQEEIHNLKKKVSQLEGN